MRKIITLKYYKKVIMLLFIFGSCYLHAQTSGLNYQALLQKNEEIQIPGTNVTENKVPLSLEDVVFRFTISNNNQVEYIEEQRVTTDENGLVSLIVSEGTQIEGSFNGINWDGKLKFLTVEINIKSNNEGFVFLDTQKILYIPHPNAEIINIPTYDNLDQINNNQKPGDLVWIKEFGINGLPTLAIYNGSKYTPVNMDYDPTNEFGLIVVDDNDDRKSLFGTDEIAGDQVFNLNCNCIQVFDGMEWLSVNMNATNGLTSVLGTVKLGGNLIEPTIIETSSENTLAITNLQYSDNKEDEVVVIDNTTGVLKKKQASEFIEQKQVILTATEGQLVFTTPLNISNINKLDVFRNGIRIAFTTVNENTIKLEPEAICYQGDQIRIVKLN